jgi:tetratricopeptide (TPR) repeat protein
MHDSDVMPGGRMKMNTNVMNVSRSHAEIVKEVSGVRKLVEGRKYKKAIDNGWKFAKGWRRIEVSPATTSFWKYMGLAYMNIKDFDGASKCFENALVTGPKDTEAIIGRSVALLIGGRVNDAMAGFAVASRISPKDPTPLILASIGWGVKGKKKKSAELAKKAVKINARAAAGAYSELISAYIRSPKTRKSDRAKLLKMKKDIAGAL